MKRFIPREHYSSHRLVGLGAQQRVTSLAAGALDAWRYSLSQWQREEHVLEKSLRKSTVRQRPVFNQNVFRAAGTQF